jgi:hypothetical protein
MMKILDSIVTKQNVDLANSLGFYVGANCIMCYPEGRQIDVKESFKFFKDLNLESCSMLSLVPFPKTTFHGLCKQKEFLTK